MKTYLTVLTATLLALPFATAHAQPGGSPGGGPQLSGSMTKLFGSTAAFSATVENHVKMSPEDEKPMIVPGKISFDTGKSRFELDIADASGLPPETVQQAKGMGMDKTVLIVRPDKKQTYLVYPALKAYAAMPSEDPDAAKVESDFKLETTELGKETVEGHPTIKKKAVVTDDKGNKHESLIWSATDLKDFPVKIQTTEEGVTTTMLFKEVKLEKPAAAQFEPPADFKRYDNFMEMLQQEMMKRMGGGMGAPPGQ